MRAILLLKAFIQNDDGLLELELAICGVTNTSIQSFAVPASSRPWKKSRTASSVSKNEFPQVWLTNHVASPT